MVTTDSRSQNNSSEKNILTIDVVIEVKGRPEVIPNFSLFVKAWELVVGLG